MVIKQNGLISGGNQAKSSRFIHYGMINITRTLVLKSNVGNIEGKLRYTVNGVSFVAPAMRLKLADYFNIGVFELGSVPDVPPPVVSLPTLDVSLIDTDYHDFVHIVLENPCMYIDS
ncbi:hypothetical protein ACH5RR_039048 [Cinchona calisaya]|uniref:Uncharacterized protein n=1 Tax=Cinchona calisaya TaxID=153742 RepID=A0ABD2Y006_9GENT